MTSRHWKLAATPLLLGAACLYVLGALSEARARAGRSSRDLATELARLRGEVETLSQQVASERADIKAKVESLARQKAELEAQRRRELVRVAQLNKRIAERRQKIAQRARQQAELRPVVTQGAESLAAAVGRSLPFKIRERQAEVRKVSERMGKKLLTPAEAVARLWDRVEDELRLARESGLYRQVISLEGSERLVEVARLGVILMYFRTKDGIYGMAEPQGKRWRWVRLSGKEATERVAHLFESFKKQIRSGFFVLPGALPGGEEGRP